MWGQIIVAVVMAVVSYALTPKPKNTSANRTKPQEITTPTVNAGTPIPVLFGRVRIQSPNVLEFGGQRHTEVKR